MGRATLIAVLALAAVMVDAAEKAAGPVRVAVLDFAAPDSADPGAGEKIAVLLTTYLSAEPGLTLVERKALEPVLKELALAGSGVVRPDQAEKIGQLFGAQLLVTGQLQHVGDRVVLAAKVITVRTGQVFGATVDGAVRDKLTDLVSQLAKKLSAVIQEKSPSVLAIAPPGPSPLDKLAEQLKDRRKPSMVIHVPESHRSLRIDRDPAAETQLAFIFRKLGFTVMDATAPGLAEWAKRRTASSTEKPPADVAAEVIVLGEAVSEFTRRSGDILTCQARVELRCVDRATGQILHVEHANATAADIGELVASKKAIAAAVDQQAEPLILGCLRAWEQAHPAEAAKGRGKARK